MRKQQNQLALAEASKNAAQAIAATTAPEFAHFHDEEKSAWAMAALINCDICRLVIAYDECEPEGIARLLCMSDIVSKLWEARNWYQNTGTTLLRSISARKFSDTTKINGKTEKLKQLHQVHRINKYKNYRDKFGYHYDRQALDFLQKFGDEDAEEFFDVLQSFVRFAGDWCQLTKNLIQGHGFDDAPAEG